MSSTLTLDRTGRVLLPSEVRRRLNLQPGSRLKLAVLAERIELTVEAPEAPELATAPSQRRVLPPSGRPLDAAAAVRSEREAQSRRRGAR
jgi:AbrB family looped-hinge helix DNA binding protein